METIDARQLSHVGFLKKMKIQIISEVIAGMIYLHGKIPAILHLDLKSDNILLDNELHAKICDFGLGDMKSLASIQATTTSAGEYRPSAVRGTSAHISPTRLENCRSKPTEKSDVYSFGILEWEILTDKEPHQGTVLLKNRNALAYHVSRMERPPVELVPNIFPQNLTTMMERAWSGDRNARPTFEDLGNDIRSIQNGIQDYDEKVERSRNAVLCQYPVSNNTFLIFQEENRNYQSVSASESESTDDTTPCDKLVTRREETIPKELYQPVLLSSSAQSVNRISQPPVVRERNEIRFDLIALLGNLVIVIVWAIMNVTLLRNPSQAPSINVYIYHNQTYILNYPETINQKSCPSLPKIDHGQITCSDGFNVNATCNVKCIDNREIKDRAELTCLESGSWSHPEPSCICPNGLVGDRCQDSRSWKSIDDQLDSIIHKISQKKL